MKKIQILCLLLCTFNASAVYVNHQGLGDVLLIPYYTVNNNLNTLVSVTNPTDTSKAIKINIREGLNGYAVLSYNVYLNAFDTWTFAFVPSTSNVAGFVGQNSVTQISLDSSCSPFLNTYDQEFLPFELTDGPQDMSRVREGFIEIIEMGELQGDFVAAADHGNSGVPANCAAFEAAWQTGGVWNTESGGDTHLDLTPGSGGLMAQADIINVGEGINYSIPVVALAGFFAEDAMAHVNPGDTSLSLDAAEPTATVMANNKTYELAFDSGIDAVSAVLMAEKLVGTYALDSGVAGQSETVLIQPTRRFYFESNQALSLPPYNADRFVENCPNSFYGGTEINPLIFDRESLLDVLTCGNCGGCCIRPSEKAICGSVFVQSINLPGVVGGPPLITQSDNYYGLTSPASAVTENGFIHTTFLDTRPLIGTDVNTNQSVQLMGLPIIGITLQKFTNGFAGPGLLAQYGGAHQVKSKIRVIEQ